jgi:hypothetical protein
MTINLILAVESSKHSIENVASVYMAHGALFFICKKLTQAGDLTGR